MVYINLWGTKECRLYMNLFVHKSTGFIYYLIVTKINNLPKCFYFIFLFIPFFCFAF